MDNMSTDRAAAIESAIAFWLSACITFSITFFGADLIGRSGSFWPTMAFVSVGNAAGCLLAFRAVQSTMLAQRLK